VSRPICGTALGRDETGPPRRSPTPAYAQVVDQTGNLVGAADWLSSSGRSVSARLLRSLNRGGPRLIAVPPFPPARVPSAISSPRAQKMLHRAGLRRRECCVSIFHRFEHQATRRQPRPVGPGSDMTRTTLPFIGAWQTTRRAGGNRSTSADRVKSTSILPAVVPVPDTAAPPADRGGGGWSAAPRGESAASG